MYTHTHTYTVRTQDDYLDCFGDPAVTGKVGTDIEENKCSWLVVQALTRVTPEQKAVLQVSTVCYKHTIFYLVLAPSPNLDTTWYIKMRST